MSKTKSMVEELIDSLQSRIDDTLSVGAKKPGQNIVSLIQQINTKENERLRDILKLQMKINDIVRQQTNESITEIGKNLFVGTANIFQGIKKQFKVQRQIKHDYNGLIYLFREYFIQSNDIRMVTKLQELFKNKAIKKPVILTKVIKMLIEITRNFFLQNVKTINQNITKNDLDQYNKQKNQQMKKNLPKILQANIKKNTLKVVCPIFIMDSITRFQEQDDTVNDKIKFGNLLFLRNKLKQRLLQRTNPNYHSFINSNKQNLDQRSNKTFTRLQSNRKYFNSLIPLEGSTTYLTKLDTEIQPQLDYQNLNANTNNMMNILNQPDCNQSNVDSTAVLKPLTTQIVRKRRNYHSRYSKQIPCKTLILNKPEERFRDFTGISSYRNNYSILNLDQKNITMIFLKKSRRYFTEIEYKQLFNKNKQINKQILSFR